MAGSFRFTVWDPWMIVSQMATLQCLFYVSLGLFIFIFDVFGGYSRSLDDIFNYQVQLAIVHCYHYPCQSWRFPCSLCSSVNITENCWLQLISPMLWPGKASTESNSCSNHLQDHCWFQFTRPLVCGATDQALSWLHLHRLPLSRDHLLVLQWFLGQHLVLVGCQHCLRHSHVCLWRISVHENRIEGHPCQHDPKSWAVIVNFFQESVKERKMRTNKALLLTFSTLRLVMAFLSRTWHVPDETWQSVELSHKIVFGNGYETWEWREAIRSYLHPLLFVPGSHTIKKFMMSTLMSTLFRVVRSQICWLGWSKACRAAAKTNTGLH